MSKLKGEIFWVLGNFSFTGSHKSIENDYDRTANKIEEAIVEEHMIKFQTGLFSEGKNEFSYEVNLINDSANLFKGNYKNLSKTGGSGEVKCELYQNNKAYFIYGEWIEDSNCYTWWARISKSQNLNS
jgi:hypothetical protein